MNTDNNSDDDDVKMDISGGDMNEMKKHYPPLPPYSVPLLAKPQNDPKHAYFLFNHFEKPFQNILQNFPVINAVTDSIFLVRPDNDFIVFCCNEDDPFACCELFSVAAFIAISAQAEYRSIFRWLGRKSIAAIGLKLEQVQYSLSITEWNQHCNDILNTVDQQYRSCVAYVFSYPRKAFQQLACGNRNWCNDQYPDSNDDCKAELLEHYFNSTEYFKSLESTCQLLKIEVQNETRALETEHYGTFLLKDIQTSLLDYWSKQDPSMAQLSNDKYPVFHCPAIMHPMNNTKIPCAVSDEFLVVFFNTDTYKCFDVYGLSLYAFIDYQNENMADISLLSIILVMQLFCTLKKAGKFNVELYRFYKQYVQQHHNDKLIFFDSFFNNPDEIIKRCIRKFYRRFPLSLSDYGRMTSVQYKNDLIKSTQKLSSFYAEDFVRLQKLPLPKVYPLETKSTKEPNSLRERIQHGNFQFFLLEDVRKKTEDKSILGCTQFKSPLSGKLMTEIVPEAVQVVEFTSQSIVCWDLIGLAAYIGSQIQKYGYAVNLRYPHLAYSLETIALIGFALKVVVSNNNNKLIANLKQLYLNEIDSPDLTSAIRYLLQEPELAFNSILTQEKEWFDTEKKKPRYFIDHFMVKSFLNISQYENELSFHALNTDRIMRENFRLFQRNQPPLKMLGPKRNPLNPLYLPFWLENAQRVTIPTTDYSPDPTKMKAFLAEFSEYGAYFLQNLKYISFQDLLSYLQSALQQLLRVLCQNVEICQPWCAVLLSGGYYEKQKSNVWIFRLLLKYIPEILKHPPELIIFKKKQFKTLEQLDRIPKHLVFFDDLIYSGDQMNGSVKTVYSLTENDPRFTYHVICACASKTSKLSDIKEPPVQVHKGCEIAPILLREVRLHAVYTQHKLPDKISTFNDEISRVIRNCDYQYRFENDDLMSPCPIVPYKQEDGMGPDLEAEIIKPDVF